MSFFLLSETSSTVGSSLFFFALSFFGAAAMYRGAIALCLCRLLLLLLLRETAAVAAAADCVRCTGMMKALTEQQQYVAATSTAANHKLSLVYMFSAAKLQCELLVPVATGYARDCAADAWVAHTAAVDTRSATSAKPLAQMDFLQLRFVMLLPNGCRRCHDRSISYRLALLTALW
jgi:hypothetical protein